MNRSLEITIRLALVSLLTVLLVVSLTILGVTSPAQSQIPSFPTTATSNDPRNPPKGVTRWGELEVTTVKSPLDDKVLFEIASSTIFNRDDPPEGKLPVEVRAQEISQRLLRVVFRTVSAKKTPTVSIATLNNRPILLVDDDRSSRSLRLITVTEPDADYHGKTREELAKEWQKILQTEIERIKQLLSPDVFFSRIGQALQILLGLFLASAVILFLRRFVSAQHKALQERSQRQLEAVKQVASEQQAVSSSIQSEIIEAEEAEADAIATLRAQFLSGIQHKFSLKRQLDIYTFCQWLLFWIFILIWYFGIFAILSRIPFLMSWSSQLLTTPLWIIILWFFLSLALRITKSAIDRLTNVWKSNPDLSLGETERIALRTATIAGALKGLATFIAIAIGILWTLSAFNIPTNSILAGGAVIGLAVSFGSQSLIKDLVNGCLILIEDQFAVGDVIAVGDQEGLVENLNLRVTQLRNSTGQLITISNSNITDVKNLTRLWSRVDFSIEVAYQNDPQQVLGILEQVAEQLYDDLEWREYIPEPPEVLGIEQISQTGMLMRVWIKTTPMQQWSVAREYRLRVRQAFELNKIEISP